MVTAEMILTANRAGLRDAQTGGWQCYYTPVLQAAYNAGQDGHALSQLVNGYRFGGIPEGGLSYNYAEGRAERGLSLAAIDGEEPVGSVIWFTGRPRVNVAGVLLPYTGSDGERLILPVGVENLD